MTMFRFLFGIIRFLTVLFLGTSYNVLFKNRY